MDNISITSNCLIFKVITYKTKLQNIFLYTTKNKQNIIDSSKWPTHTHNWHNQLPYLPQKFLSGEQMAIRRNAQTFMHDSFLLVFRTSLCLFYSIYVTIEEENRQTRNKFLVWHSFRNKWIHIEKLTHHNFLALFWNHIRCVCKSIGP